VIPTAKVNIGAWLALAGFALSALVFYPGLFTPDSLVQFDQARSGQFADWHPPVMAALWRALLVIYPGPQPLFLLHLALFWTGTFAVADALARRGASWAAWFPLVGLLPFVFNYLGVLWKDVALAASWLFAAGWTLRQRELGRPAPIIGSAAIWLAFSYGALVRANSIFAAAPLAFYLAGGDVLSKRIWPQIAACILTPALILAGTHVVNYSVLHAQHEHAEDSLLLFDLHGMSHVLNRNLLPGSWTSTEAQRIPGCYHPDSWSWFFNGDDCDFITDNYYDHDLWGSKSISSAWVSAVKAHPGAYMQHRLAFTAEFMRFSWSSPPRDIWTGSAIEEARYTHHPGPIFRAYERLCEALAATPFFRPWFWLLLSAAVFAGSLRRADSGARRFASALSASGIIYLLTYIPVGVASDFRYAYWSICATLAAMVALICAPRAKNRGIPE
jgi:hypothetical protein